MAVTFVVTGDSVNLTIDGKFEVLHRSHQNYDKVIELLKSGDYDEEALHKLMNPAEAIKEFGEGQLEIRDGKVFYSGAGNELEVRVDNSLIERIQTMASEGFSVKPLVLFFENLMKNPSNHAVTGLYRFLENNKLPLTDDGCFLAYKKVRHDFGSIHKNPDGTHMDNSVGKIVSMLRNQVDDDHDRTCSTGLHFASFDYASSFYSCHDKDDRLIVVKVNPADVVAFPHDYNNAKGRTCRYEVVSETPNDGLEYLLDYVQGVKTIDNVRDLIKQVRDILIQHTPVVDGRPSIDWTISAKFVEAGLHKTRAQKVVDAVRNKFDIKADFDVEKASIYNLIKFIGDEVDLAEVYASEGE